MHNIWLEAYDCYVVFIASFTKLTLKGFCMFIIYSCNETQLYY